MDFIIKVTDKQLDIIGNALCLRPYAEVFELIASLQSQATGQQKPADPSVTDVSL